MQDVLDKVLLIVNPTSQNGNGEQAGQRAYELLKQALGEASVRMALTQAPRHAVQLAAAAAADGYSAVIALGGDGVIHEAANGLMAIPEEKRPVFGIIPVGSGNDYARTLGVSEQLECAVEQLLARKTRLMDVGCVNGEYFVETLSFGLDAGIAIDTFERRKRTGKTGIALYLESGFDQLFHHLDTYRCTAVFDGERRFEKDVKLMAVQIGKTYGGGFKVCPDADPTDGVFDICACEVPISLAKAAYVFLKAKDGGHLKYRQVIMDRASRIQVSFDHRPPAQVDGEEYRATSFDVSIERQALKVLGSNC